MSYRDAPIERAETVYVAESVTAGMIQSYLSPWEKINFVSKKVAVEMVRGVAKIFNSNWSIATTDYWPPNLPKNYRYYSQG